ncbi:hypothetical protein AB0M23_01655 [Streptomyces sp. NPDC052077]|uniref:hypothetical protein n=1 Tax=Streptomyces sp. NPDC052077 TaxID=3154757 RepID=UPI003431451C
MPTPPPGPRVGAVPDRAVAPTAPAGGLPDAAPPARPTVGEAPATAPSRYGLTRFPDDRERLPKEVTR